ncbi:MAG: hypothetical protein JXA57_16160 [Armatimonadetes bacterium]|nr:hypothetical protein [Armatimonadota bacterium]
MTGSDMCVRHEVSVTIYGRRDGCVAELLLHVLQVLALVDKQGCERVPQIVNPHLTESCRLERGFKHPVPQVRLVDHLAVAAAEHQIVLTPRCLELVVHEDHRQSRRHTDGAH